MILTDIRVPSLRQTLTLPHDLRTHDPVVDLQPSAFAYDLSSGGEVDDDPNAHGDQNGQQNKHEAQGGVEVTAAPRKFLALG